jgi:hypothetical protein
VPDRGPLGALAGAAFGGIAAARGRRRALHPQGIGFRATLRVTEPHPAYGGAPLLARAGDRPALVRFSRAIGLPAALPDLLGIGIRVLDAHGPDRHQDLLLTTSGRPPLHTLLLPAPGGFFSRPFSSILPYRLSGHLRVLACVPFEPVGRGRRERRDDLAELAEAADARPVRYRLCAAPLAAGWRPLAELVLGERLPAEETETLRLNPWNCGEGIVPRGPFMGLRDPAYRASQGVRLSRPTPGTKRPTRAA